MRRFCAGVAAVLLGTTLSGCWLQPGSDEGHTNWNPLESTLTAANVEQATELWSSPVGDGPVESLLSLGGKVFASAAVGQIPSGFGLAAGTGDLLWTYVPPADPALPLVVSDPVYVDGRLEVAWTQLGVSGLIGIDAATGAELFLESQLGYFVPFGSAVAGGEPAVGTVAANRFFPDLRIYSVDWRCDAGFSVPSTGPFGGSTFAFVGGNLVWSLGTEARGFRDCDPTTQTWATAWSTELGGIPTGVAALGDTAAAYVDDSGTMTLLDTTTGAVRWTTEVGVGATRPTIAGGKILVATTDGRLAAYEAETGAPSWEATLGATGGRPTAAGDVVYVAVGSDVLAFGLFGCGGSTCPPLATVSVGSDVTGGPIVDNGRLLVGTADSRVVAFGLPD